jgi:hypothetical protein
MTNLRSIPWLSLSLLFSSYFTFGWFLHRVEAASWLWGLALAFAIAEAMILTFLWIPAQRFFLTRIQSDVGYSLAVLTLASLAVIALVWFHISIYLVVLVAASLLVRLDTILLKLSSIQAFTVILTNAALALGISYILTSQMPTGQ